MRVGSSQVENDVIIVGAGAVGLALAIKLARRSVRVLVLEAGPPVPPADYPRLNRGRSVGRHHQGLTHGRMRALGGTTRLWGGQLVPFGEQDFDGSRPDGPSPWPVRYAEMAPRFDEAFSFLGIDAAARNQEAIWQRMSKLPASLGDDLRFGMNVWLPQPDFTALFGKELASLPTLTVLTDAPVTKLLFDTPGRASGVKVTRSNGESMSFSASQIVLAAGTFENVRLLLATAATDPSCGFADNAHIGVGYIDHLHGLLGRIRIKDPKAISRRFDNIYVNGLKFGVKIRASDRLRRSTGIVNCAGTINTPTGIGALIQDFLTLLRRLHVRPEVGTMGQAVRQSAALARILVPVAFRYVWQRRSTSLLSLGVSLGIELEQIASAKSCLTLDPEMPPETAEIVLHWDFDGREIETVAVFGQAVSEAFEREGLGTVELDPRILSRDPAFLESCHDSNHQMGGSRMAAAAEEGVVDADLKVFGTDNLFALGACTFPSGSFANPTLTAIAFAMRLAEHLSRKLGQLAA